MLRRQKFRPFETKIIWGIALLLFLVGTAAAVLALQLGHWRLGLASVAVLILAAVYVCAAIRGKPL
jgi:hypothetical protein